MDTLKRSLPSLIFIFIVIAAFLFLRFYLLDQRIIFDWDQERDANQIRDLIILHKPTLIGPRVVSENGFFLAPYYTYLLAPFYLISRLHPIGSMYLVITVNILFVIIGFMVIRKLFGTYQGLSFMALWAINVLLLNYDIIPWNPLLIPLWIISTWWLLDKMFYHQNLWQWILLGLLLGTGINLHMQFLFMIIFVCLLLTFSKKQFKLDWKKVALLTASFLITFTPLLLFDLRHEWLNWKLFLNFFFSNHSSKDLLAWVPVLDNFLEPLTFKLSWFSLLFYSFITGSSFYLFTKQAEFKKVFFLSAGCLLIITLIGFSIYGKRPSEYYFLFLYPYFFIIFTELLSQVHKSWLIYLVVPILLTVSYSRIVDTLKTNQLGLYYKNRAVTAIKKAADKQPVVVTFNTLPGRDTGFRYLMDYYHIKQSTTPKVLLEINVPPKDSQQTYGQIGIKETKVK